MNTTVEQPGQQVTERFPTRLPVLAYGTLRVGGSNWRAQGLHSRARYLGTIRLDGYRLVSAGGWYPYAVPAEVSSIVCDVLDIRPEVWAEAIANLDLLEGCNEAMPEFSHYTREVVRTEAVGDAYLYVAGPRYLAQIAAAEGTPEALDEVPQGDWAALDPRITSRLD